MKDKKKIELSLIQAARSVFSTYGYKKTTMEDIAKNVGMAKSSLYYYFKNKEEIFEKVIIYEAEMLKGALSQVFEKYHDPKQRLSNYILVRMKTFKELSNYYNAIFNKDLAHFKFIEQIRITYDQEEIATLEKILSEGIRLEVFKLENTSLASTAIFTAIKGLEVPLFWKNKYLDIDKRVEDLLKILFYGILKR